MSYIPFPSYYDDAPIDLRFVYAAERPAGKRGFLKCVGDHFEFEDGTLARFWGTCFNGGACFPDKAHAEKMALRLAKYGVNIVRYHQFDAEWDTPNIFALTKGPRCAKTTELDPEALDRLDYLTYCLKREGIYVYMDIFTSRRFKTEDGIVNAALLGDAAKPYSCYDKRMIELQKKLAYDFWNHYNPYTKLLNKDDPVYAMGEILNEGDLFGHKLKDEHYIKEFRLLFREWLDEKGIEYDAENCEVNEENFRWFDHPVVEEFRIHLMQKYFTEMKDYLREIGVKMPIAGTTWHKRDSLVRSNAVCDYTDAHAYFYDWKWDEHKCAHRQISRETSPVPDVYEASREFNKPFFVSEWDMSWPNAYRAEAPLLFASIGALQNYAGYAVHTYSYGYRLEYMNILGKEVSSPTIGGISYREGIFSTWNDPAKFGLFYHAALILRRGDVSVGCGEKIGINGSYNAEHKKAPAYLCASEKCRIANVAASTEGADRIISVDDTIVDLADGEVRSDTGELYRSWDKGYGTIDTQRTKCAYGSLSDIGRIELDGMSIDCKTDFAVIAASSLTNDSLDTTDNILLTAVGRAENTDAKFEGEQMLEYGRPPILVEVIEADIELRTDKTTLAVWAVNAEGFYVGRIPVTYKDGKAKFKIGDTHKSIYYLIYSE